MPASRLHDINSLRYTAIDIECEWFKTLDSYRKFNADKYVRNYVIENMEDVQEVLDEIVDNYDEYMEALSDLESCRKASTHIENKQYFKSILDDIQGMCVIRVLVSYTSPAGRNYYERTKTYGVDQISNIIIESVGNDDIDMGRSCSTATDSFKYEQRSAMTKKMRYEILKRDNYTCQLCGRKAPEVILEVDHKQPVALGGKTVPDNLWTLCRDCNRGRGVDV